MHQAPRPGDGRAPRVAVIGLRGLPADRPKAGGGERAIEEWFSRLALRGYDNIVYCRWHYNRRPPARYRNIRLVSLPSVPTKSLDNLTNSLLATLHTARADTADVIQYGGMGTALLAPLGKLCRKKVVVALDGIDWERPKWGPAARLALRLGARSAFAWADAVHVDNALAQRQFVELFGRSPELITLAAETPDNPGSDALSGFGLEPGTYVLFVGLLKPDKGVHVLVEAYRRVQTTLPLVVVGDSPDAGDYVRRLKGAADERVRFPGYVYGPAAQQLFANCALYVQPSLMEGNSPALMTAMGYGRAVVASDIEQNVETIGDAGATFVSGDAASLAGVLTKLIGDPQEVGRLGSLARDRIARVYNWDRSTDRLDRLYRRVSKGEAAGSPVRGADTINANPLAHSLEFWRPLLEEGEARSLARYCRPGDARLPGINAWQAESGAHDYRVVHGGGRFSLHAAVHPIDDVPAAAEVVADILDRSGNHHSYVLWFPSERSVVVPFDPDTAIESFWREAYVPAAKRTVLPRRLLGLYYAVKPMLPTGLKDRLRRRMARRAVESEHLLDWPVDNSLDRLQRLMLNLIVLAADRRDLQFPWFWPDAHPWAALLTHDVETGAGLDSIERVMTMEQERGLRSSFNMVPLDYPIPSSVRDGLTESGFEVGVHGLTHDGLLFSNRRTFLQRAERINTYGREWRACGFRSPATYRNPDWFADLDFEYDSSFSNNARFEPQPGGCASFFPFRIGDLVELPITLPQDHTLFGLLGETSPATWLDSLRQVRDGNGMACILGHPDPARGYVGMPQNAAHYAALLDELASSDAWIPLPRDLARWWRTRATTPSEQIEGVAGMSFGTARLDAAGRLEILPPAR